MDCSCLNKKKLSDEAVKEIENLIGNKLAFIIVADVDGNKTPLTSNSLEFEVTDLSTISKENPIKNDGVFDLDNIGFINYFGSCKCCWVSKGKLVCVNVC